MTGNYHEFAFGPARDKAGNYHVGLNPASSGASIRPEIRGEFRHYGISREQFYKNHRAGSGRMYSATPFRGWILKIAPDGKTTSLRLSLPQRRKLRQRWPPVGHR